MSHDAPEGSPNFAKGLQEMTAIFKRASACLSILQTFGFALVLSNLDAAMWFGVGQAAAGLAIYITLFGFTVRSKRVAG